MEGTKVQVVLLAPKEISLRDKVLFRENNIKNDYKNISQNVTNVLYVKFLKDNLGIASLAAFLRKSGYTVQVRNLDAEESNIDEICQEIVEEDPILVGISLLYDLHAVNMCQIAKKLRKKGYEGHLTLGGPFISLSYKSFLLGMKEIDSVITGEGEIPILNLVNKLKAKESWKSIPGIVYRENRSVIINSAESDVVDFSDLPFPARDMYEKLVNQFQDKKIKMRVASIQTSRGCRGRCTYCSAPVLGKLLPVKWRCRKTSSIIEEIKYLVNKFGVEYINIIDENFYGYGKDREKRLIEFAQSIIESKLDVKFWVEIRTDIKLNESIFRLLRQAGVQDILLGLESGSQSMLNRWRKGTTVTRNKQVVEFVRKMGFIVEPSMIMVDPYTTIKEFKETVDFILETEIYKTAFPFNLFNQLIVFPGTDIEEILISDGILEPINYESIEEISDSDDEIFGFCKKVSSRQYEFVDSTLKVVWETLTVYTNRINYLLESFFPTFSQLCRETAVNNPVGPEKDILREFIVPFGNWRRNIGELARDFFVEAVSSAEKVSLQVLRSYLEERLQHVIDTYSHKYLKENVESFIEYYVGQTSLEEEGQIILPEWLKSKKITN